MILKIFKFWKNIEVEILGLLSILSLISGEKQCVLFL
jgi:hypothetical protein